MLFIDIETFPNFILLSTLENGKFVDYINPTPAQVSAVMNHQTVSFNGLKFDLPVLAYIAAGGSDPYGVAQSIISEERHRSVSIPEAWSHLDLYEVAPGAHIGLKLYGGRMHAPTIRDLPYDPLKPLSEGQQREVIEYCHNDLLLLKQLYERLERPIRLRESMSAQYGLDLMSKSDPQIAEAVLLAEIGGNIHRPPRPATAGRYRAPKWMSFYSPRLRDTLTAVTGVEFQLDVHGAVVIPTGALRDVTVGGRIYRMGIGGLHSAEQRQSLYSTDKRQLIDCDVASYYPSIILGERLYPPQCGERFLTVYRSIVERRLAAKRAGDTSTADSLKIAINGSFGKLGSAYSKLYGPDLFKQVTVTGQLALLMLIEHLVDEGIEVVSANTDGIVTYPYTDQIPQLQRVIAYWESLTGYRMEQTPYRSIHSRDVNNYIAVKPDGKCKCKGVYADSGLMKNPSSSIVNKALQAYLTNGTPLEETIRSGELTDYLTVRQVKGGGTWNGNYLGKVVRWYYAINGSPIIYASNGNRVAGSDSCRPCMTLSDARDDIDYGRYLKMAESSLEDLGLGVRLI